MARTLLEPLAEPACPKYSARCRTGTASVPAAYDACLPQQDHSYVTIG